MLGKFVYPILPIVFWRKFIRKICRRKLACYGKMSCWYMAAGSIRKTVL